MKLRMSALSAALFCMLLASPAAAQIANANADKIAALRPPAGSSVAIIVFEDLQCPDCARAFPLVKEVAKAEKVTVIHHDFPLPMHNWSFEAAVTARYFDAQNTKTHDFGDEFREFIFKNQRNLTPQNLAQNVATFAQEHGLKMPMMIDPAKKLEAKVRADFALGQKIGIQHTPTIFVVGNTKTAEPFVEVVDRTNLTQMVRDMKQVSSAARAGASKGMVKKPAASAKKAAAPAAKPTN